MHQFIMKADLKAMGFTDFQASETIRIIKHRLKNAGLPLYGNPRIGFVPVEQAEIYFFGVSHGLTDNIVSEFKKRLIFLPELAKERGSKSIAEHIIREAQQTMVKKNCGVSIKKARDTGSPHGQ